MKGDEEEIKDKEIDIENEKEKTKTRIGNSITLIAIILVTTLMVLAVINYQPSSVSNKDKLISGDKNTTNGINMSIEEKNFRTWFVVSYIPINEGLKCISKAAKSENFSQTEICAKILKEDSNRSLNQIDSYNTSNISATLRSGLTLYQISLENYHIGGKKLEIGARNENVSIMMMAVQYIQNGTNYVNNVKEILKVDANYTFDAKSGVSLD